MAGCCNARTLSIVSASVQITAWLIGLIVVTIFALALNSDQAIGEFKEHGKDDYCLYVLYQCVMMS